MIDGIPNRPLYLYQKDIIGHFSLAFSNVQAEVRRSSRSCGTSAPAFWSGAKWRSCRAAPLKSLKGQPGEMGIPRGSIGFNTGSKVNPRLIIPKRLFNWEATMSVLDEMTSSPLIFFNHGLVIRG